MWTQALGVGAMAFLALTTACLTGSLTTTLEVLAVAFVLFMTARVARVVVRLPRERRCTPPELLLPTVVDRDHLPTWEADPLATDRRITDLVEAVVRKISVAADETAIHAFVTARLETLRREADDRYAAATTDIDALGFEGVMGTILGLMVFLAQAGALFDLPDLTGDSAAIVAAIATNVGSVDLTTVMSAFVTSLIGWGARAWLGGVIEGRRRRELASVTEAEGWLQDGLLARLSLPAQIHSVLRLGEVEVLTGLLIDALARVDLSELAFDVEYVAGGIRLRARSGLRLAEAS